MVSHLLLLQESPLGLQNLILLLQAPQLTNEGSKLVEALDPRLLLVAHGLDVGVHLPLQGVQQALVQLDDFDGPHTPSSAETLSQIHVIS